MLFDILTFVVEVAVTLVGSACLLRLAMRWRRMSMGNPVGRFVQALSDWLVMPLQRLVPPPADWTPRPCWARGCSS